MVTDHYSVSSKHVVSLTSALIFFAYEVATAKQGIAANKKQTKPKKTHKRNRSMPQQLMLEKLDRTLPKQRGRALSQVEQSDLEIELDVNEKFIRSLSEKYQTVSRLKRKLFKLDTPAFSLNDLEA